MLTRMTVSYPKDLKERIKRDLFQIFKNLAWGKHYQHYAEDCLKAEGKPIPKREEIELSKYRT